MLAVLQAVRVEGSNIAPHRMSTDGGHHDPAVDHGHADERWYCPSCQSLRGAAAVTLEVYSSAWVCIDLAYTPLRYSGA